jgi:hypothetical protein
MSFWLACFLIGAALSTLVYVLGAAITLTLKPITPLPVADPSAPSPIASDSAALRHPYRLQSPLLYLSSLDYVWMVCVVVSYFSLELDGYFDLYRTCYTVYFVVNQLFGVYLTMTKRLGAFFDGTTVVVTMADRATVDQIGLGAGAGGLLSACLLLLGVANMVGLG